MYYFTCVHLCSSEALRWLKFKLSDKFALIQSSRFDISPPTLVLMAASDGRYRNVGDTKALEV